VNPGAVSQRLPDFPWDSLAGDRSLAGAHPDGIVDLSVGTPVDPTPDVVRRALEAASDSPGYPHTIGRVETRQAAVDWLARCHGVTGLGLTDETQSVAWVAHLGGYLAGIFAISVFDRMWLGAESARPA